MLSCFGTPKGTRTPDLLIRSQSLYPTELSAHADSRLTCLNMIAHDLEKCKHFFQISEKIYRQSSNCCRKALRRRITRTIAITMARTATPARISVTMVCCFCCC